VTARGGSPNAAPSTRERVAGCLVGGAVGDALGAPIEFMKLAEIRKRFGPAGLTDYSPAYGRLGAITDDTQMTLFTAEGLLRAICRGTLRGIGHPPVIVRKAYLRWLKTQGQSSPSEAFEVANDPEEPGWLVGVAALHSRRGPGNTCLSALRAGGYGTPDRPINDSKGCGGVMRAAPAGIAAEDLDTAFQWGCEMAAITHGHPTGWLSAGALAVIVRAILDGKSVRGAVDAALPFLEAHPDGAETRRALEAAVKLAREGEPSPEKLQTLGEGWVAEQALAIGVYAALSAQTFRDGVLLAVNHNGDSDSTGSIAGNILGAAMGAKAIPEKWRKELELRDVIAQVAADLVTRFEETEEWWKKYPGC